ncbi:hypothetical protein JTB14_000046 [Gonioctena quinquepunctata]|nr:hypothetical protein JTB14_000046 [Gonioctena quinquepunctata]
MKADLLTSSYGKIILDGLKKIDSGLIGQDTEFSWILSGQIQISNQTNSSDKSTVAQVYEVRKFPRTPISFQKVKVAKKPQQGMRMGEIQ